MGWNVQSIMGYGMGRHKLRTTNTIALYQWQFECTEIVPYICSHHLMFQHDNARPHITRICKQFLEAENVFFHGLHTHQACHPLGCSGSTGTRACFSSHQYPETSHNIPQAAINILTNSMQRRCVALHEANGCHTRYWLVFWSTPLPCFFKGICNQQMHTVVAPLKVLRLCCATLRSFVV